MLQQRMGPVRHAVDWMFRDRTTGAITIAQWPNLPLWLFGGLSVAAWLAGALSLEERKKRATWAMRLNMVLRGFWPCSE